MSLEGSVRPTLHPVRPDAAAILAQLDRILESPPFRASKRCSDLLRHVVQAKCGGNLDDLKERTLGITVFDRDPDYDTNQDPVVRNTAVQIRKRLAQYYLEPGHEYELRIELPPGAYLPQAHFSPALSLTDPLPAPVSSKPGRPVWRSKLGIGLAFAAVLIAVLVAVLATIPGFDPLQLHTKHTPTAVELFWAPLLKQPGPIVLCVGQGHTYKLKGNFDRLFEGLADSPDAPAPPGSIPLSSISPIWDRTIGISDAQTLVRLTALFAGAGHAVEFRGGRSTSLGDLRGRSSVLIGAFNNSWTLSLTGELRFYFDEDTASRTYLVRDRLHPENRAWEVRGDQLNTQDHADYAIVSRVFDPTTEQAVLVAAGIKGGGTAAAGEFLASSSYLAHALANAPAHWEKRNIQFVLKTRLLGGTAGPPELQASHYW